MRFSERCALAIKKTYFTNTADRELFIFIQAVCADCFLASIYHGFKIAGYTIGQSIDYTQFSQGLQDRFLIYSLIYFQIPILISLVLGLIALFINSNRAMVLSAISRIVVVMLIIGWLFWSHGSIEFLNQLSAQQTGYNGEDFTAWMFPPTRYNSPLYGTILYMRLTVALFFLGIFSEGMALLLNFFKVTDQEIAAAPVTEKPH